MCEKNFNYEKQHIEMNSLMSAEKYNVSEKKSPPFIDKGLNFDNI
ncbi:hypothetical protein GMMP1_100046 [Candidatus Magnetomoraceae bacterium gMMP-1]